jgi:hypothetical protein
MALKTPADWALLGPVIWIAILFLAAGGRANEAIQTPGTAEFVTHHAAPIAPITCYRDPVAAALEVHPERAPGPDRSSWSNGLKAAALPQDLIIDV